MMNRPLVSPVETKRLQVDSMDRHDRDVHGFRHRGPAAYRPPSCTTVSCPSTCVDSNCRPSGRSWTMPTATPRENARQSKRPQEAYSPYEKRSLLRHDRSSLDLGLVPRPSDDERWSRAGSGASSARWWIKPVVHQSFGRSRRDDGLRDVTAEARTYSTSARRRRPSWWRAATPGTTVPCRKA